jgi:hypothetical protein
VIIAKRAFSKFVLELNNKDNVFKKIERFFEIHQDLLWKNQNFPIFFLNEVNQNPDLIKKVFAEIELSNQWQGIIAQVEEEKLRGIIRPDVNPIHLIVNIISLSMFPYLGKPILCQVTNQSFGDYNEFLIQHRKNVAQFVINSIKM